MKAATVSFRPIRPGDEPALLQVYASTRLEELAPLGWSVEQQAAFLSQQFAAQHSYYQQHHAAADFLLILVDGCPAGRLYVDRRDDELRLIDVALLPEHRGAGLGTRLLGALMEEASATGRPVRIHVEKFNRALHLYERLGFTRLEDRGLYWFMEWRPASQAEPAEPAGCLPAR